MLKFSKIKGLNSPFLLYMMQLPFYSSSGCLTNTPYTTSPAFLMFVQF